MDSKKAFCSMCGATIEEGQEYTYVFPNGNESPICESCFNKPEDEAVELNDYQTDDDFDKETEEPQRVVSKVQQSKAAKSKGNQRHTGNYKCIPAPMQIVINSKDDYYSAAGYFEEIINKETSSGWKYVGMESVSTIQPAGCLASLFGKKAEVSYFNMLIFEKTK